MSGPDALATIAEIAIAIAGFAGIAAVLGRRSQGDWTPEDAFRLQGLLYSSFSAVIFSFVPIVLLLTRLAPSVVWSLSSGAALTWLIFIVATRSKEVRRRSETRVIPIERSAWIAISLPSLAMLILHGTNVALFREPWPYVAAAVCSLGLPFFFFVRLLRSILKPDVDAV
jgi:hypothetical protein